MKIKQRFLYKHSIFKILHDSKSRASSVFTKKLAIPLLQNQNIQRIELLQNGSLAA